MGRLKFGELELAVLVTEDDTARGILLDGLPLAEREVVRLALAGLSNADIAARRGISVRTVANQLSGAWATVRSPGASSLARTREGGKAICATSWYYPPSLLTAIGGRDLPSGWTSER